MANMPSYEPLRYSVRIGGGDGEFFQEGEWRDITAPGDDATTWRIRYGDFSFRVTITGRTANTGNHPIPATEALKVAMLLAVREEIQRLNGARPSEDHRVTVSKQNLSDGVMRASPTR